MIYGSVYDIVLDDIFLDLPNFVPGRRVWLKLEGLNPAGSIKLKTAVGLVESVEHSGLARPGTRMIESTSGNLGIALGVVCAAKGYKLTTVIDPNTSTPAVNAMRALGVQVVKVTSRDRNGGFLGTRINYIINRIADDPELVWLNQYANVANVAAHRDRTARMIHREFGEPDVLAIGVGTSGTLMGCVEYFSTVSPRIRIIAVDSEGSVTLGGAPGVRRIPGLGASRVPEIFQDGGDFEKIIVPEHDTIDMCRRIATEHGLLVGGSTGTVLAAVARLGDTLPNGARIIAISPDLGDKYLETVYNDHWVETSSNATAVSGER